MFLGITAAVLFLAFYVWNIYNSLVVLKVRIKEAWSQIDVQLNRRADLIPNLVKTVKSYAKHEKDLFENVTKARSQLITAGSPNQKAKAEGELEKVLKSLFAVAENYPQLRASENYSNLQKELSDTEDKIAYARQFYNTTVSDFNAKIEMFPSSIIAKQMNLAPREFFEVKGTKRELPEIEL